MPRLRVRHELVLVEVDVGEIVGGIAIVEGREIQERCACDPSYRYTFGHETRT